MCNYIIHDLLNVFEDSVQRVHTIGSDKSVVIDCKVATKGLVSRGVPIHIVSVADIEISTISVGANIAAKNRYDTPIYN